MELLESITKKPAQDRGAGKGAGKDKDKENGKGAGKGKGKKQKAEAFNGTLADFPDALGGETEAKGSPGSRKPAGHWGAKKDGEEPKEEEGEAFPELSAKTNGHAVQAPQAEEE